MTVWRLFPRWREPGTPPPLRLRDWANQGLCATQPGNWYPEPNRIDESTVEKAVCGRCPVREACLAYALDAGEAFGIWGGLDPDERLALVHRLTGITAPDDGLAEHDPSQAA